jgi:acyl carrier protein
MLVPEQPLVLREQLPLPRPYLAPRTSTEQRLAEIWQDILSMDRIGMEDRYDDLGGDSFFATTIFHSIQERFGVSLPVATLMEAPSIAELAARIDDLLPNAGPSRL